MRKRPRTNRRTARLKNTSLNPEAREQSSLGSAARLAAALLLLRRAEELERAADDRRLIAVHGGAREALAQAEVELKAAQKRTVAARARVNGLSQAKASI